MKTSRFTKIIFFIVITTLTVFLFSCSPPGSPEIDSTATPNIETIVAEMLTATSYAPTATLIPESPTAVPTLTFSMTVDGRLQGILAFIRYDNVWVSINGVESQLTTDAVPYQAGLRYRLPQISPDSTQIAYLKSSVSTDSWTLVVSDIDGENPRQLTSDVSWVSPKIEWSNDSQRIYYPVHIGVDTTTFSDVIQVKSINLTTGDVLEHRHFSKRSGCGGGSSDIADGVSALESIGFLGAGKIFSLSPESDFVIHSISCKYGFGILDLKTDQNIILDSHDLSITAISPKGTKIAAASKTNIVIFNASNGEIEYFFFTPDAPEALLWNQEGTEIFYSSSELVAERELDEATTSDVSGSKGPIRVNLSTLWQISLDNGESTKIVDIDAHAVKPIFVKNQKLLVAAIENTSAYFDYLEQGNRENLVEHYPSVNLVEVDLETLSLNVITYKTTQPDYFPLQ